MNSQENNPQLSPKCLDEIGSNEEQDELIRDLKMRDVEFVFAQKKYFQPFRCTCRGLPLHPERARL
jgi:hypothetical protein